MGFLDDIQQQQLDRMVAQGEHQKELEEARVLQLDSVMQAISSLMMEHASKLGYPLKEIVRGRLYQIDDLVLRVSRFIGFNPDLPDPAQLTRVAWAYRVELVGIHIDTFGTDKPWVIIRNMGALSTLERSKIEAEVAEVHGSTVLRAEEVLTYQDAILLHL